MMHATPTLIIDDELILRPADTHYLDQLVIAFEESLPEVIGGLPWYDVGDEMHLQLEQYLYDVGRGGRIGRAHHWVILDKSNEEFLGLVAFDRFTRVREAHWNLGYWTRKSATRRGIAKRAANKSLEWISTTQGGPTAVEITVDPNNEAGLATCNSIVKRWRGERVEWVDGEVEIAGEMRHHITFILPRLPLIEIDDAHNGNVWLSLDTDDLSHHPKVYGHPKRSRRNSPQPYKMSETLAKSWEGFFRWRKNEGAGLPVTLFVISEQLEDVDFAANLKQLLGQDETVTIGCHGKKHRCWSAWPEDRTGFANELAFSMEKLSAFAGENFRPWFRAPGGYIAPWMIEVLSENGITLDSSGSVTKVSDRKVGLKLGFESIRDACWRKGLVERFWFSRFGVPLTGPALRIPLLKSLAKRQWKKVTKDAKCVSENTLLTPSFMVYSLYWHLLDHAGKNGNWQPPIHPSFTTIETDANYKR